MNKVGRLLAVAALAALARPAWAQSLIRFHVRTPQIEPIRGLDARIHQNRLHLTLNQFLTLVLANNTQIRLLRLNAFTAQDAVLAAESPLDPQLVASFNSNRTVQPQTSQTAGASTLSQLGQNTSLSYSQALPTGQQLQLDFGSNRFSSNSAFATFNPSIGADVSFSFTQPLLRNRAGLQNFTNLLVARTQLVATGDTTAGQIADQLVSAADQYWATVQARDQIEVEQQALSLARKSYQRDQKALKLGALAPGDIFTSQAQVAQDETALLQAQYNYRQQLDLLRRLIGADLDRAAERATIVLDDDPSAAPPAAPLLTPAQAVAEALRRRPEMDALHRQSLADRFSINAARDNLRPQLNLTGSYGSNGLAGDEVPIVSPLGTQIGGSASGFGSALGQVFGFGSPTYGFTLSLNLPLRNSAGQAALANALVAQTAAAYQQRNERQQITQEVRLADTQLRMAVAVVHSAITAQKLAQDNVAAEQQKYQLGSITVFELLQAQVQLSNAKLTLLGAYTGYQQARVAYERATWTLLRKLKLSVNP
jgi:outer membrane protein